MLILTRRVSEAIKINDDITITVLGVKGMQVRLGIDAPKEVPVNREEIYNRIRQESNSDDREAIEESLQEQQEKDVVDRIAQEVPRVRVLKRVKYG